MTSSTSILSVAAHHSNLTNSETIFCITKARLKVQEELQSSKQTNLNKKAHWLCLCCSAENILPLKQKQMWLTEINEAQKRRKKLINNFKIKLMCLLYLLISVPPRQESAGVHTVNSISTITHRPLRFHLPLVIVVVIVILIDCWTEHSLNIIIFIYLCEFY